MNIRDAFAFQARACATMGSPFMEHLMGLCATRLKPGSPVADRLLTWPGNPAPSADSVPLRLAGGLHALCLSGQALEAVYPPHQSDCDALWQAVEHALAEHSATLLTWLDQPPQTNEVRRASVILAALAEVRARTDRPVRLIELGCSGGLNLRADHFCLTAGTATLGQASSAVQLDPEWTGTTPKTRLPEVADRIGIDIAPIDPLSPDGQIRLLSYLWPDQPDRLARTRAAIQVASHVPATLVADDAGAALDKYLKNTPDGTVPVVYHTVAWQYFPDASKHRAKAAMANHHNDVFQISMEGDEGTGAAVNLTQWPGGAVTPLGRVDFHGRWVNWQV